MSDSSTRLGREGSEFKVHAGGAGRGNLSAHALQLTYDSGNRDYNAKPKIQALAGKLAKRAARLYIGSAIHMVHAAALCKLKFLLPTIRGPSAH